MLALGFVPATHVCMPPHPHPYPTETRSTTHRRSQCSTRAQCIVLVSGGVAAAVLVFPPTVHMPIRYVAAASVPKAVIVVVDSSGSMSGSMMPSAKDAAKTVIDTLGQAMRLGTIAAPSPKSHARTCSHTHTHTHTRKRERERESARAHRREIQTHASFLHSTLPVFCIHVQECTREPPVVNVV